jgi:serine/threonine protein kinase
VLYHCLTGEVPFPRDNDAAKLWAHVNAPPPAPSALRPELPETVDAVIARGMDKEPERRFPTATELAFACARALGVPTALAAPARRTPLLRTRAGHSTPGDSASPPTVVSEQ